MPEIETKKIGRAYRVCTDSTLNKWDRYSYWTQASDVELEDGSTLQELIDKMEPNSMGSVLNAQNAEQAYNARFADNADESEFATISDDVNYLNNAIIDTIVEIRGNQLVTETIRPVDDEGSIEIVDNPVVIGTETVETVDDVIRIGDTFSQATGKIKKKLSELTSQYANLSGMEVTTGTLRASSWDGDTYPLDTQFPPNRKHIIVMLDADSATSSIFDIWEQAKILQSATTNDLKALGTVPSVNIPVIFYVINIGNSGSGGDIDPSGGTPEPIYGGTTNYNDLLNKPSINNVPLIGNITLTALMDSNSAVSDAEIDIIVESAFSDTSDDD